MTLTPEADLRLHELASIVRAQASRLCRRGRGGTIMLKIRVEGGRNPRISRDTTITVEEYPLVASLDVSEA